MSCERAETLLYQSNPAERLEGRESVNGKERISKHLEIEESIKGKDFFFAGCDPVRARERARRLAEG